MINAAINMVETKNVSVDLESFLFCIPKFTDRLKMTANRYLTIAVSVNTKKTDERKRICQLRKSTRNETSEDTEGEN